MRHPCSSPAPSENRRKSKPKEKNIYARHIKYMAAEFKHDILIVKL